MVLCLALHLPIFGHWFVPAGKSIKLPDVIGTKVTDTIKQVIQRIQGLRQFVVRVHVPEEFRFSGSVPFDMEITGSVGMVTVWALTEQEAQQRAEEFFQNTP